MKPLSILTVAYPFAPVRSDCAGGAEQIVFLIDSWLSYFKIRSFVIATESSRISGHLIAISEIKQLITVMDRDDTYRKVKQLIEKVIFKKKIDLIHFHGVDFIHYVPDVDIPFLVTLHLPIDSYPVGDMVKMKNAHFNFVSVSQKESAPIEIQEHVVINNGIDLPRLKTPSSNKGLYILCIGRICPEKGFDIGLRIAKKLNISLKLAGRVFPYESHIQFFEKSIVPELDGQKYIFIGEVGKREKIHLMVDALCVLIPSQIDETSSLVAMEALSCGTPVVASNRGALSSIVENGLTGYICNSEEEMEHAILNVYKIDRRICMEIARQRFSAVTMIEKYIELYDSIIT